MQLKTVAPGAWSLLIQGQDMDMILQAKSRMRLCVGSTTGVPVTVGIEILEGQILVIPAGLEVSGTSMSDHYSTAVIGPFGV